MPDKKIRRVTNPRRLNAEEAAEVRKLRALVDQDKDDILSQGRRILAEKRQRNAASREAPTLGQRIRCAREALGLTQAELATRARVAQGYLSYLEQDQREPSLSIAARLARALDLPLDEMAAAVES